jgi:hypothetical protein
LPKRTADPYSKRWLLTALCCQTRSPLGILLLGLAASAFMMLGLRRRAAVHN